MIFSRRFLRNGKENLKGAERCIRSSSGNLKVRERERERALNSSRFFASNLRLRFFLRRLEKKTIPRFNNSSSVFDVKFSMPPSENRELPSLSNPRKQLEQATKHERYDTRETGHETKGIRSFSIREISCWNSFVCGPKRPKT